MKQKQIGIAVILLSLLCGVMSVVTAQESAQPANPQATEKPASPATAPAEDPAALKRRLNAAESALARATAVQRREDTKKAIGTNAAAIAKELGPVCAAAGGRWIYAQAGSTTMIGCVGK